MSAAWRSCRRSRSGASNAAGSAYPRIRVSAYPVLLIRRSTSVVLVFVRRIDFAATLAGEGEGEFLEALPDDGGGVA
jgi:hypothetical protein